MLKENDPSLEMGAVPLFGEFSSAIAGEVNGSPLPLYEARKSGGAEATYETEVPE